MTAPEHYDAVVIGAGQAGTPLARPGPVRKYSKVETNTSTTGTVAG